MCLGFSSLGQNNGYASNLGLWDQAMAFRWIRENIADFGGDPTRITAQGLSAGAGSVGLLALSPRSRSKFCFMEFNLVANFRLHKPYN
jgi:para-nitrobenzyl esterase